MGHTVMAIVIDVCWSSIAMDHIGFLCIFGGAQCTHFGREFIIVFIVGRGYIIHEVFDQFAVLHVERGLIRLNHKRGHH